MSSLKKVVKQKQHRERSQPLNRQRFGILEKHKDYVERAKDFNKKEKTIQKLRRKAYFRNPDEFYKAMIPKQEKKSTAEIEKEKVMQSQDINYIMVKKSAEQRKVEKLQKDLHLLDSKPVSKHTIFVDTKDEAETFSPVEYFGTIPEAINRAYNRPKAEVIQNESLITNKVLPSLDAVTKAKKRKYDELQARIKRSKEMGQLLSEMELRKQLLTSKPQDRKQITTKEGKVVYKWKRIRKQ